MGIYDDIINLPHHVSERHPQMPIRDRAAQFSPFAALTGYESAVKEAARITDEQIELSEEQQEMLSERLLLLEDPQQPEAAFTFFVPDARKKGGAYVTVRGKLKRIDRLSQTILLTNGTVIQIDRLSQVESDILSRYW
nr:hypothetical protein [Acutalibacter muris]